MVSNLVTSVETFELSIVKIEGTQSCSEFLLRYLEDLKITKNVITFDTNLMPNRPVGCPNSFVLLGTSFNFFGLFCIENVIEHFIS